MKSSSRLPSHSEWKEVCRAKIVPRSEIGSFARALRAAGQTIATINGSFDLLHAGHLHILYEASKQADLLILALNSDSSIRQYKGERRPIVPLEYRLEMAAAIEFIDYVTWFDELDPRALLEEIRPDVHVNGAEYGENCIEAEVVKRHGGRIHIVELIPGLSTSQIVQRIQCV